MKVLLAFPDKASDAGFDRRSFQTAVELRLRLAGIKVLEPDNDTLTPFLFISINVGHQQVGQHDYFAIDVELNQAVRLLRDRSISGVGATWSQNAGGFGDAALVRSALEELVDDFVNAYLSVNPK